MDNNNQYTDNQYLEPTNSHNTDDYNQNMDDQYVEHNKQYVGQCINNYGYMKNGIYNSPCEQHHKFNNTPKPIKGYTWLKSVPEYSNVPNNTTFNGTLKDYHTTHHTYEQMPKVSYKGEVEEGLKNTKKNNYHKFITDNLIPKQPFLTNIQKDLNKMDKKYTEIKNKYDKFNEK